MSALRDGSVARATPCVRRRGGFPGDGDPPDAGGTGGTGGAGGRGRGPTGTPDDASTLLTKLLLASLGMLFAASMLAYGITRYRATTWDGYRVDGFFPALITSTLLLIGCSALLHFGLHSIRRGESRRFGLLLAITWVLALGFLASQTWSATHLFEQTGPLQTLRDDERPGALSIFLFYVLTSLHAVHVVGGIVPLAVVTFRNAKGRYGPGRTRGVLNLALYWHFLDAVWLVIALALALG